MKTRRKSTPPQQAAPPVYDDDQPEATSARNWPHDFRFDRVARVFKCASCGTRMNVQPFECPHIMKA